jgi:hypothetical protein
VAGHVSLHSRAIANSREIWVPGGTQIEAARLS